MATGRPTTCTDEITDEICGRLAGGESLRAICGKDEQDSWLPARRTALRWLFEEFPEGDPRARFRRQYERARAAQAEGWAEEITDIADTTPDPNKARIRVDARKWSASKLLRDRYGDRQVIEGGEKPVQVTDATDKRKLAREVAFLLRQAEQGKE